jgi:hypothetical protein
MRQCARQRQTLLHAPAEFINHIISTMSQVYKFQQIVNQGLAV